MDLNIFSLVAFLYILAAGILFLILFSVSEKKEISALLSILWLPVVVFGIIAIIILFFIAVFLSPLQSIKGSYDEELDLEINNHAEIA